MPGLEGPVASKVCFYPMSRDGHFVVGRLPASPLIIAGVGLCGHGFKFAPAIGEALAALAQDREPPVDISFLDPARFA
jgi:glycine/D-amino acid oxidase-like deaminating enzyme